MCSINAPWNPSKAWVPASAGRFARPCISSWRTPFADADAEIRPAADRSYQVRHVGGLQLVYWLDVYVREVCVVRVERL